MPGATQALRSALANEALGRSQWVGPGSLYVSLHTGDPGTTGANAVSGAVRRSTEFGAPLLVPATEDEESYLHCLSTSTLTWTGLPAVDVTHVGLWTAGSGGTCLFVIELPSSVSIDAGQKAQVVAGKIDVRWY